MSLNRIVTSLRSPWAGVEGADEGRASGSCGLREGSPGAGAAAAACAREETGVPHWLQDCAAILRGAPHLMHARVNDRPHCRQVRAPASFSKAQSGQFIPAQLPGYSWKISLPGGFRIIACATARFVAEFGWRSYRRLPWPELRAHAASKAE
jgi:hypothetical protein